MSYSLLPSSPVSSRKETSLSSSKKYAKRNNTEDYESVIKQFDDLMSELTDSKKLLKSSRNSSILDEGYLTNESNNKDKTGHYDKKSMHLVHHKKTPKSSFVKESKTSDDKTVHLITPEQSKLTDPLSSCYNDRSFPEIEENVPWINSHLWDLENKRDASQLLKPLSKAEENIPVDAATVNSKGNDISLQVYVTEMAEKANDPSFSYYSKQVQAKDRKNPDCKKVEKYNFKTFSHAESHFREKSLYDPKIQASKTFVTSSLLRSPKASRSPTSKYLPPGNCFLVKLYIETKDLHLGPFSFEIYPKMSLRLLKLKVEQEHGIKSALQKWILGKSFAVDNEKALADYNVLPGSSIIVYVGDEQRIFSEEKQNEMNSGKPSSRMNEKSVVAVQMKDGKTLHDFTNTPNYGKVRDLVRKDSFDKEDGKTFHDFTNTPIYGKVRDLVRKESFDKEDGKTFHDYTNAPNYGKVRDLVRKGSFDKEDGKTFHDCTNTSNYGKVRDLARKDYFDKEDGETFYDCTNTPEYGKVRDLVRKDSFGSKLALSNSKSEAIVERSFPIHKYRDDNLDVSFKNHKVRTDDICSPVAKRRLLKTNVKTKTKIKASEYEKQGLSAKCDGQFRMDSPKTVSFENYPREFISHEKKSFLENKFSNSSDFQHSNEIVDNFEPVLMNLAGNGLISDNINSSELNNNSVSLSNQYSQSHSYVENVEKDNLRYSNAVSFTKTEKVLNNESRDNVIIGERSNSKYSETKLEKEKGLLKESDDLMHSDNIICMKTEISDSAYNHMNLKDESLFKDESAGNTNSDINECSSRNFCFVKELISTESVDHDLSSNAKHEFINTNDAVNKVDIHTTELQSENFLQLNTSEKCKNSKTLSETSNSKSKSKRSVTSLIRKLSLTRKTKSSDDEISSQINISTNMQSDEMKDDKEPATSNSNINRESFDNYEHHTETGLMEPIELPVSDVHIEISSQDPNTLLLNSTESYTNEKMQEDSLMNAVESVKNFELLLEIENMDLVENKTNFTCPVCFEEFMEGQGVILHDCLHIFCRDCLSNSVYHADSALVKCPYRDDFYSCESHLQQREIKALVSEEVYEKYLQRSIITAEGLEEKSFHCKTPDCRGWCIYDNAINVFHCPVCSHYNCLNCQAIHEGLNCRQYQDKLKMQQKLDKESEKTLELLNQMIQSGKALHCPKCEVILLKKWGCDWLKCSVCKTEICWITKGPRWGPAGQGDTSGGCRCGVNGVKCHPSCTYCH